MSFTQCRNIVITCFVLVLSACGGQAGVNFDGNPAPVEVPNPQNPDGSPPNSPEVGAARALYVEQCASCHGDIGQGGPAGINLYTCTTCGDHDRLYKRILETMPVVNPESCDEECSLKLTRYIMSNFSDEDGVIDLPGTGNGSSSAANVSSSSSISSSANNSSTGNQSSVGSSVSSASMQSSSNGSTSSVSTPIMGNAILGQQDFAMCVGCHGRSGPNGVTTGGAPIDPSNLQYVVGDLTTYIVEEMPPFSEDACGLDCARNIVAYMALWQSSAQSSSQAVSSSSQAASSSSMMAPSSAAMSSSSMMSSSSAQSSSHPALDGAVLYQQQCAGCHTAGGVGYGNQPIILENWTHQSLTDRIDTTMPPANPSICVGACADAISDYLLSLRTEVACTDTETPLPRRLRLLTNREYANTVTDLLSIPNVEAMTQLLPGSNTARGYDNNARASSVTTAHMSGYWNAASSIAEAANVDSLLSCGGMQPSACANSFVQSFGLKAFRRPLSNQEINSYTSLFLNGENNVAGARNVIQAMLSSSSFLYRSEIGTANAGGYELTPYETASYLSYTFWGSMPDNQLLNAAASNNLRTAEQLRQQANRLLNDDRAPAQFSHFARQWLKVSRVAGLPRDSQRWNQSLAQAMDTELDLFVEELFFGEGYRFEDLFTADFVFANSDLANFYGISGGNNSFQKLPANNQRGGLLTMGALLATNAKPNQSDPIHRGLLVRNRLLCQEFGTPPPNVGEVEPLDPNKSTRDRFAAHTENENCQFCHQHIDPIGFSFENYDAIGEFRFMEGNVTVDNSGTISGLVRMTDPDSYDYAGPKELAEILTGEGRTPAASCFVDQFHTYMQGVTDPDQCVVQNVMSRWSDQQFNLRELWLQAVSSPSFLKRQ